MVMTRVTLTDSGFRTIGSVGTETEKAPGDGDVAGAALTLNVNQISYIIQKRNNDRPVPNRFENNDQDEIFGLSEVDSVGIAVPTWSLGGVFDMETLADRKMFAKLVKMTKTKGIKQLSGETAANSWLNYVNYYDDYYAGEAKGTGTTVGHIHVRVSNFSVRASAEKKHATWSLDLAETG